MSSKHRGWSVLLVSLAVFGIYAVWTAVALRHGPESFIHIGRIFVAKSHASPAIDQRAASYHYDGDIGFDGQFAYFIAVDPVNARYYADSPAYRYTRIVYPLTARAVALGRADLVPYSLVLVNLGRDLHLDPAPEPLLAPPGGKRWAVRWSSEDPRYGGGGTAPPDTETNWRLPGEAALVLLPEDHAAEGGDQGEGAVGRLPRQERGRE